MVMFSVGAPLVQTARVLVFGGGDIWELDVDGGGGTDCTTGGGGGGAIGVDIPGIEVEMLNCIIGGGAAAVAEPTTAAKV